MRLFVRLEQHEIFSRGSRKKLVPQDGFEEKVGNKTEVALLLMLIDSFVQCSDYKNNSSCFSLRIKRIFS